MNPITASTWIDTPPSDVFALVTKSLEASADGGTSIRREPPRSVVSKGEANGRKYTRTMMFEPDRGGTIVSIDLDFEAASFVSRLISPMSGTANKAKKDLAQELQNLKTEAENARSAVAGG